MTFGRFTKRKIFAFIISFLLVLFLFSQIESAELIKIFIELNPLYLVAGFFIYILAYMFRALRFYLLLNKEVRLRDLFNIVCVHNMVNNILPARTGELSYILLLGKLHHKKSGEGIASLFIARVFDLITISSLFFISIFVVKDIPDVMMKAIVGIALFLAFIVILTITLLFFGESFLENIKRFIKFIHLDKPFIHFAFKKGEETIQGFEKIKTNGMMTFMALMIISFSIWLSLYLFGYLLVIAMGIHLSYFTVLMASTFAVFTTLLPIQGIAGFGTMEGGWALGFIAIGLSKEVAISSGFGYHIITLIFLFTLGSYGFLMLKKGQNL